MLFFHYRYPKVGSLCWGPRDEYPWFHGNDVTDPVENDDVMKLGNFPLREEVRCIYFKNDLRYVIRRINLMFILSVSDTVVTRGSGRVFSVVGFSSTLGGHCISRLESRDTLVSNFSGLKKTPIDEIDFLSPLVLLEGISSLINKFPCLWTFSFHINSPSYSNRSNLRSRTITSPNLQTILNT